MKKFIFLLMFLVALNNNLWGQAGSFIRRGTSTTIKATAKKTVHKSIKTSVSKATKKHVAQNGTKTTMTKVASRTGMNAALRNSVRTSAMKQTLTGSGLQLSSTLSNKAIITGVKSPSALSIAQNTAKKRMQNTTSKLVAHKGYYTFSNGNTNLIIPPKQFGKTNKVVGKGKDYVITRNGNKTMTTKISKTGNSTTITKTILPSGSNVIGRKGDSIFIKRGSYYNEVNSSGEIIRSLHKRSDGHLYSGSIKVF